MSSLVALRQALTSTQPSGARSAPDFLAALRRVWEAGDAVLPLPVTLPEPEVERLLAELRPSRVLSETGERPLPDGVPVDDGTALVVPTSGTTGAPKGVVLTHAQLRASAMATAARLGTGAGDRWLCCVPPSHIAGLMVLVRSALAGSEPILHPRFDVGAIAAETSAALVSLVPTMLRRLLAAGVDVARFRWILLGGGPIPPSLVAEAEAAGAHIVTTYGMTETCGGVVYDGHPLPGVRVAVEDGEIRLSGPMVMSGYRLRPTETAAVLQDGWFRTADAGELEPGGRLRVLGRRDDLIVTGGEKVAPVEVATVLGEHPRVAEAAVVGQPDPEWGQAVVAIVAPLAGADPPSLADLRAFVSERLAHYKAPRHLVVVPELPRGPTGKPVGLRELAERALAERGLAE
ncbi:MAG TPA: AMP-binding protein [Actinomycetota bacterium]|nr:AMP-binding protein [Actinomycetota bacterium]